MSDNGPRGAVPSRVTGADVAVVVVVLLANATALLVPPRFGGADLASVPPLALLVAVLGPLPLLFRRQHPWAVFLVVHVLFFLSWPLAPNGLWGWESAVALYTLAVFRPVTQSLVGLGALAVSTVVAMPSESTVDQLVGGVAFQVFVWGVGLAVRRSRRRATQAAEAARTRALQAAREERVHLARELHDSIAHQIAVIAMHAGAARVPAHDGAGGGDARLGVIQVAAREALDDLRRLVSMMRSPATDVAGDGEDPTAGGQGRCGPHGRAGLADLPDLAEAVRRSGVPVALDICLGDPPVPSGIQFAAYRAVQEALTNALRHARPSLVSVRATEEGAGAGGLRQRDGRSLVVAVRNDGVMPAAPDRGDGHGLVGLRERVAGYGGSVTAGAVGDGLWEVVVRLPLPGVPEVPGARQAEVSGGGRT